MLSFIWCFLVIISFIFGLANNSVAKVTDALFDGAASSVTTIISLLGIMCFWSGLMEIMKRSGLTEKLAKILSPIISFLFPGVLQKSDAFSYIILNITANILGLSNAATPLGLKAIAELDKENGHSDIASDDICMFVLINTASVTLVPSTVIAIRSALSSSNPAEIIVPVWISSLCALAVGVFSAKLLSKRKGGLK